MRLLRQRDQCQASRSRALDSPLHRVPGKSREGFARSRAITRNNYRPAGGADTHVRASDLVAKPRGSGNISHRKRMISLELYRKTVYPLERPKMLPSGEAGLPTF